MSNVDVEERTGTSVAAGAGRYKGKMEGKK
jgi:hypothetical protein